MARIRILQDLSFDELRQLIIEKRRAERHARLDQFQRTGQLRYTATQPVLKPVRKQHDDPFIDDNETIIENQPVPIRRVWFDRVLFLVEAVAVIGLLLILFNGISLLRNLNREMVSVLEQPTLTPTALIMAVVLPSGHTPPNSSEGIKPNESEIPEHLRPLVQSLANLPVPTPGPQQTVRIQIPAINVDAPVVQADGWEQLKKGVGQHMGTSNPGEKGNIVLSGHNDVFGEVFRNLDKLQPGDTIILFTSQRTFTYIVRQTQIVEPTRVEVMAPSQEPIVTLISCYPYMVDNQRIAVSAVLQQ